jgi:hypothetical protein
MVLNIDAGPAVNTKEQKETAMRRALFCKVWHMKFIPFLFVLASAVCTGCYSPGRSRIISEAAPVAESVRSSFGRVGLLLPESSPPFVFQYPRTTGEAMVNTAEKTWKVLDPDDELENIVAGAIVSGVFGIVGGAVTGVSIGEIQKAETRMQRALEENPLLSGISNCVQSLLEARGSPPLIVIPDVIAAELNATDPTHRNYHLLTAIGVDTLMEIRVERQGLQARERGNPPMAMEAVALVYLTSVPDGALLFTAPVHYRGHQHRFTRWADEDARRFRSDLKRVGRKVGGEIVEQVFAPVSAAAH